MVAAVGVEEPLPSDHLPLMFYSILLHPNPPYVGTFDCDACDSLCTTVIVYFIHIYVQQKGAAFGIGVFSQNLTGMGRWGLKYYSIENVDLNLL